MEKEEYVRMQTSIIMFADLVCEMDLDEFIAHINHAEAVGPIVDPTLYMQAQESLDKIGRIARALNGFKKTVIKIRRV